MGRHKKQKVSIDRHIRIPKELDDIIETESKKGSSSYNNFLIELLEEGIKKGSNKAKETLMRINAKFEGKCVQCEKTIRVSQTCWWAREVGVMCEECHQENELEGIGDVTLARYYARKRELKKTVQGLTRLADDLADKVNELSQKINLYGLGELHEEIEKQKRELLGMVDDFLKRQLGTKEEVEFLNKASEWMKRLEELTAEARRKISEGLLSPAPLKKQQRKEQSYVR